jgi:uncharacterized protein YggE
MAQTAKPSHSRLRPTPKALENALKASAIQAQRMAEAFGLKVPGVEDQQVKTRRPAAAVRQKTHG